MPSTNGTAQKNVVLITGAGGWLGNILAGELLKDPKTPNVHLILVDIVEPKPPKGAKNVICRKADLCDRNEIEALFKTEYGVPDTIYCFHGIMSRGSEDNFELGIKVNVDSIREMLKVARENRPSSGELIKFIFTSSLAVYGGDLPEVVDITTIATPEGSYGTGKLVAEFFVQDYTRRGWVDGRILRLPTIVVRPGVPSAATSAFISGIIREPLHGVEGICPIGDNIDSPELSLAAWIASPEVTIENFIIAKHIPAEKFLKHTRVAYLPGFTVTVKEELEALREIGGEKALSLVSFKHDEVNKRVVSSWPARFSLDYPVKQLGFKEDVEGIVGIVRRFKEAVDAGLA